MFKKVHSEIASGERRILKFGNKNKQIKELESNQYIKQTFVNNHATYALKYDEHKPIITLEIGQDLSLANMLIKDIESLEEQIFNDTKELEGINSIIKTIKICPLCGHKLEG